MYFYSTSSLCIPGHNWDVYHIVRCFTFFHPPVIFKFVAENVLIQRNYLGRLRALFGTFKGHLITNLFTVETTLLTQSCYILLTITSETIGTNIWARSFLFCNVRLQNVRHLCGVDSLSCQYISMHVKVLLDTRKFSFIFALSLNGSTEYFTRKKLWNNDYNSFNIVRCNITPATLYPPRL